MPGAEAAAAAAHNAFPMGQVWGLAVRTVRCKHEANCVLIAHVVPSPCCETAAPMHLSFPPAGCCANPPKPAFPARQVAKANRRSRRLIGSDAPLADFESLLLDAGAPHQWCHTSGGRQFDGGTPVVAGSLTVAHQWWQAAWRWHTSGGRQLDGGMGSCPGCCLTCMHGCTWLAAQQWHRAVLCLPGSDAGPWRRVCLLCTPVAIVPLTCSSALLQPCLPAGPTEACQTFAAASSFQSAQRCTVAFCLQAPRRRARRLLLPSASKSLKDAPWLSAAGPTEACQTFAAASSFQSAKDAPWLSACRAHGGVPRGNSGRLAPSGLNTQLAPSALAHGVLFFLSLIPQALRRRAQRWRRLSPR